MPMSPDVRIVRCTLPSKKAYEDAWTSSRHIVVDFKNLPYIHSRLYLAACRLVPHIANKRVGINLQTLQTQSVVLFLLSQ